MSTEEQTKETEIEQKREAELADARAKSDAAFALWQTTLQLRDAGRAFAEHVRAIEPCPKGIAELHYPAWHDLPANLEDVLLGLEARSYYYKDKMFEATNAVSALAQEIEAARKSEADAAAEVAAQEQAEFERFSRILARSGLQIVPVEKAG